MPGVGDRFRTARESRGLSLSEAAEHLRIRSVYLGAIEDENWSAIGAPVYIRGFLRTYARFLGLEPEEAVAEYNAAAGEPSRSGDAGSPRDRGREPAYQDGPDDPGRRRSSALAIWGLSLVAVAMVAFVVYNEVVMRAKSPAVAVVVTASPAPSAVAPSPSPVPPAAPVAQTLQLKLDGPSWLQVTVDGNASIDGTFPAGTSRTFHGKSATVRLGNAGAVEVVVDGKSLGKLGAPGAVVERTFAL
jgi:cytoskeletal protein RodZ